MLRGAVSSAPSSDPPCFPRSSRYDPAWVLDGYMGPNPLWLTEWLCEAMPLRPGMRVLDLGCGRARSSVFLAREFDVQVYAADLWASVDDIWRMVVEAGVGDRVVPVKAEAHALPFAAGFFDAIVSIDAYAYFGTDLLYLHYLSRFLRLGGMLGIVTPGLMKPLPSPMPRHLVEPQGNGKVFWEDECIVFQTVEFWRELVARSGRFGVTVADAQVDGWKHWRDWEETVRRSGKGLFPSDEEALGRDGGEHIGFVRVVAERNDVQSINLYDSELLAKVMGSSDDG